MILLVTLLCLATAALGTPLQGAPRLDGRIVGGVPADIDDYPYQLSLKIAGNHECGAVIIGQLWAVTAAQCVGGPIQGMLLRAGTSLLDEPDDSVGTSHRVIHKIVHPNYNSTTSDYDLALLQVDTPFPEKAEILLPPEVWKDLPKDDVTVLGWGNTHSGGIPSPDLLKIEIPVISNVDCQLFYGTTPVTDQMICTLYDDVQMDACQGDSGGPMVYTDPDLNAAVLAGIVSWGRGCALPNYPGVYTRVSTLAGWIRENVT